MKFLRSLGYRRLSCLALLALTAVTVPLAVASGQNTGTGKQYDAPQFHRDTQEVPVHPDSPGVAPGLADARGIYSLQASVRFDDLQTVVYDPQARSLTLLGERPKQLMVPVPYLDHLATALESDNPSFTLPWSEPSQRQADALMRDARTSHSILWDRIVANARSQLFSPEDRLTKEGLRILKTLNFPVDDYEPFLTNKYDVMARTFQITGGEQQATIVGSYARSLRDPDALNDAIRELAMSRALDAGMTSPGSADLWETFIGRFAGVFDLTGTKPLGVFRTARQRGEHVVLARNAAVENILASLDPLWARTFPNALELSAADNPHIHLPPDLVQSLAGFSIFVKPTWNRIDSHSRLAEVMFDADLLLKWIVADPSLLGSDAAYHQTEYEWSHRLGSRAAKTTTDNVRFWISPYEVELAESADGGVLEIRKFTMCVRTNDPASEAYARYLTTLYDRLADEFPTLAELRECAKIVAVAEWLKKKDAEFRLPQEGRGRWEPPERVCGFITINAVVQVQRTESATENRITGKWISQATLEGGVSLALGRAASLDGNVLFDGARGPESTLGKVTVLPPGAAGAVSLEDVRRVVVPEIYDNQTLKKVLSQKTIPPPPMPPGATARAQLGTRKLEYVSILRDRLGERANAETVQEDLREAVHLAEKIQFNDRMLNDLQAGRIKSLEAFQQAEAWARDEREQFLIDMFDIACGGFSSWLGEQKLLEHKLHMAELLDPQHRQPRHWLLISSDSLPTVKGLLADADTARQSAQTGENFDRHLAIATRSTELLSKLANEFELISESVEKRAPGYASLAVDTAKASAKIIELEANRRDIATLAEQAGNEALYIQRLQDSREEYFLKLQQVIHRLEQAAPP